MPDGFNLSNRDFPWMSLQINTIAEHQLWAFRMSYAGELGWELHMPQDAALSVYDALMAAGEPHGLTDYGSFAMNAMRMEKGFKGASELTNEVTLAEADVLRFARSEAPYLGRENTLNTDAMSWVCAYLSIETEGDIDGHGGEAVLLNGRVVGSTASVAFGPTVGKILAFAYINPVAAAPGTALEVVVHGRRRAAQVLDQAAYDPENRRPRTDLLMEALP